MPNKKNGFTLVELLVTIVILGIITGLSIPLIRNIQSSHEKRQYETYRDSLEYASKIYLDSYEEDLFGHDDIGCAIVSYQQMKGKKLVKDIPIDGVSCDTSETFVKIIKFDGQYTYQSKISCGTVKEDGSVSKEVEIPEGNVIDSTYCGLTVDTRIRFNFTPENSPIPNVKRKNIKLVIDSNTGINSQPIIQYAFSDTEDLSHMVTEWKRLDLNIPSKKKQKAVILSGNTVKVSSDFITPKNYSGKLYLVLKIGRLQDLGGNNWTNTDNDIVSSGYYAVDNQAPQLNDSEIKYSKPFHRKVTPTLDFKATDNLTSESDLRMCISQDTATDTCSKNITYIKNKTHNWVTYNKNKVLPVMENASNGENHNIFISVADQAGNYVTQQFVYYQSLSDYSITYNLDGGIHGASHPEIVDFGEEFTVSYPSKTVTPKFVNDVGATIDYSSSTVSKSGEQVPYTFSGWNISGMDESTHTFGSRTSNNIEESSVLETQFKNLRETSNGVLFEATWTPPKIVLPKVYKTGNTCKWKSTGNYEWDSGGKYTPIAVGGATARTITASCSPNTYIISYDSNGGSGTMSRTSCVYGNTCNLRNNTFTKTGYEFNGWYTAASGGNKVTSLTVTQNTTVYAHWKPKEYSITYDVKGGINPATNPVKYTVNTDTFTISNPTKSGYIFAGWTGSNGANPEKTVKILKGSTGNKHYTANWESNVNCKLKVSGTKGNNNWYVSDVTISFESKTGTKYGIGTSPTPNYNSVSSTTMKNDGTKTYYGYVKNGASEDKCSITVKRDAKKPTCSADDNTTWKNSRVTVFWGCSDSTSGCITENVGSITLNDKGVAYGYLSEIKGKGSYTITDNAGNSRDCPYKDVNVYYDTLEPPCDIGYEETSNYYYAIKINDWDRAGADKEAVYIGPSTKNPKTFTEKIYNTELSGTAGTLYAYERDEAGNYCTRTVKYSKYNLAGYTRVGTSDYYYQKLSPTVYQGPK